MPSPRDAGIGQSLGIAGGEKDPEEPAQARSRGEGKRRRGGGWSGRPGRRAAGNGRRRQ